MRWGGFSQGESGVSSDVTHPGCPLCQECQECQETSGIGQNVRKLSGEIMFFRKMSGLSGNYEFFPNTKILYLYFMSLKVKDPCC